MTAQPLNLECFTSTESLRGYVLLSRDKFEHIKTRSFEAGRLAGRKERESELADSDSHFSEEFAQKILDMSFTFYEARAFIMLSLRPLVEKLAEVMLPETSRDELAGLILNRVKPLVNDLADGTVTMFCAPQQQIRLRKLAAGQLDSSLALDVKCDPALGDTEVFVHAPTGVVHLDMERALNQVRDEVSSFYTVLDREAAYG